MMKLFIFSAACLTGASADRINQSKVEFYYENLETQLQTYTKWNYVQTYDPVANRYQEYYYMPNIGKNYYWNVTDTDSYDNKLFAEQYVNLLYGEDTYYHNYGMYDRDGGF